MSYWRAELRALLQSLPVALAGALFWRWLDWPLPWMIGPLIACASLNSLGGQLHAPIAARNSGQWVIGLAMGTYFTHEAVGRLLSLGLPLLLSLLYTLLLGAGFAWALYRFAGASLPTAVFGGAVGGASEMALQGERHGARVETIAAVHSTRVMLVVLTLPFVYRWLEVHGHDTYVPGRSDVDLFGFIGLGLAAVLAGWLMQRVRSPNAWMIGPLLVSTVLTANGLLPSGVPAWVSNSGQLLIGLSLGTRFERGFFTRAPRLMLVVTLTTLCAMLVSAGFGVLVGWLFGVSPATMILATAPGGLAEMSITAKTLGLGVPIVTSFHIVRLLVLVLFGGLLYRWLAKRWGWLRL